MCGNDWMEILESAPRGGIDESNGSLKRLVAGPYCRTFHQLGARQVEES